MKRLYSIDDDDRRAFEDYYVNQCGHGLPVFYGSVHQKGHGIGSLFGGLFRSVFPILKKVAPAIGRKALQTGIQIAGDVARGQSFKESAKTRVFDALQEGINKIVPTENAQSGSGIRRGRKKRKIDIFS
jgi:hypothetical protein